MSSAVITINGNVGRDPVIRFTKSGKAWTKFSVAVTERVKEGDEWIDGTTTWFEVSCWNRLAEDTAETVKKGSRVVLSGRFKTEKWTGEDGVERTDAAVTADWVGIVPKVEAKAKEESWV